MIIRSFSLNDIDEVTRIWKSHYSNDFTLPNFSKMMGAAVIEENSSNRIISVAGIKPIIETVMLTDKDVNARKRWNAINELLRFGSYTTKKFGYDELHCFIQDPKWLEHLKTIGFRNCIGEALVKNL